MRREYKAIASACTMLVIISTITSHAWAAGLHFTKEEVAIWRTRKDHGPYKDEWTVILDRATKWRNNPTARWPGNTQDECWNTALQPDRRRDAGLRDAGFVYLITGDTSYRNAARTALLAQTEVAGTDWTNTRRWCPNMAGVGNTNLEVAGWVRRLVYGYSYIRDSLSVGDRTTLDAWFLSYAVYLEQRLHNLIATRFPNRLSGDYSACSGSFCPGNSNGVTHVGGHTTHQFNFAWENIPAAAAATIAAIGVVVNDATMKARAKRFVKEWLMFQTYPGGQVYDQKRWSQSGGTPQVGYFYAGRAIGSVITIADHLARDGDTELYDFETTAGMFGSKGGPKSLLRVVQHFAQMSLGYPDIPKEYAFNTSNEDNVIDNDGNPTYNHRFIEFVNLTPANVYYQDAKIKQAYAQALPGSWSSSGYDMLCGDWGTYPRVRFMFGQMEGKVWPYSPLPGADSPPPSPPKKLRVQ